MQQLEEVSEGIYKIPEKDLKRLKKNQERRNQRAAKRKSNSHRTYSSARRHSLGYAGLEMFEPSLAEIMEHKEEQQEDDFIERQLDEFIKGGLK